MGYEIKSKRLYRDSTEELVTVPKGETFSVEPCTPVEGKLLWMLSEGMKIKIDADTGYKIAVACHVFRCYRHRRCEDCFFEGICAYPKDPDGVKKMLSRAREILSQEDLRWTDPCTPIESQVLRMIFSGNKEEAYRMDYKLAVACIKSGCIKHRSCKECFFSGICAYPRNPEWFRKKGLI